MYTGQVGCFVFTNLHSKAYNDERLMVASRLSFISLCFLNISEGF